jgi:hypothetical protein
MASFMFLALSLNLSFQAMRRPIKRQQASRSAMPIPAANGIGARAALDLVSASKRPKFAFASATVINEATRRDARLIDLIGAELRRRGHVSKPPN